MPIKIVQLDRSPVVKMVEINGLPNPSMIDTLDIDLADIYGKSDVESQLKYQARLVRINDVSFSEANGVATYVENDANTNRTLIDDNNRTLLVRNSNYADFKNDVLPEGKLDVVGLLYFYGTNWQLYLRSVSDVIVSGNGGTKSMPLTVTEAIAAQNTGAKGWVGGFVVGAVAPEVTTISGNDDIEWKAPTTLPNTLVIADDPECKDYTKCIVISLPQGSTFREKANLVDNTWLYKQYVKVKGTFANYMGAAGITKNNGSSDEFVLPPAPFTGGLLELEEGFDSALPADWANVQVSGDKAWYQTTFNNNGYAAMTGYKGTQPPFDAWLITPLLDIKNATDKTLSFRTQVAGYNSTTTVFEVYILNSLDPTAASVKVKLNPALAKPSTTSTYSDWVQSGTIDLSQWADGSYVIGFRFYATKDANYATWCVDDVKFGKGGATPPPAPTADNRADFETMGTPTGQYGSFTSTKGWVATNCMLLSGGENDSNPTFKFIGFMTDSESQYAYAPTLNGKTSSIGTLVSPVITGGMTKLNFSYGAAMSDKVLSFRVDVKQNGNVVKTWTVTKENVTQKTAYQFAEACTVTGDFIIEITNLCPSNSTSNKDRVSIWNLTWDK